MGEVHIYLMSCNKNSGQIKDKEYKILHSGSMTGKVVRVGFHIDRFGELESVKNQEIQAGDGRIKQV